MSNPLRPISISLSPNTEKDDIRLALRLFFKPWQWKISINQRKDQHKSAVQELEEGFKKYLGVTHALSFNSGRSALMAILDSLGLKKGDEVLLQAFTCNAVVNPIIWSGLKPVFVDCNDNSTGSPFNIDIEDLKRKITHSASSGRTPKSKAVIVQHTFGLPAQMEEIIRICHEKNLMLIEDCAHALGAEYRGYKIGIFGKAAFFSFGRDKVISSVYGGMAVTNNEELAKKIKKYQEKIGYPSYWWIGQQLLHPVLMNYLILPIYRVLGKYFLVIFQWLGILSKAVQRKEKKAVKPRYFPKKLPNALAVLAINQFKKLQKFISHQKEIAEFYGKNLKDSDFLLPENKEGRVYLKYSILSEKQETDKILKEARKSGIFLDDGWRKTPIVPSGTEQEKMGYIFGSCPQAEKIAKNIINLPTHINISQADASKIVNFLKELK